MIGTTTAASWPGRLLSISGVAFNRCYPFTKLQYGFVAAIQGIWQAPDSPEVQIWISRRSVWGLRVRLRSRTRLDGHQHERQPSSRFSGQQVASRHAIHNGVPFVRVFPTIPHFTSCHHRQATRRTTGQTLYRSRRKTVHLIY